MLVPLTEPEIRKESGQLSREQQWSVKRLALDVQKAPGAQSEGQGTPPAEGVLKPTSEGYTGAGAVVANEAPPAHLAHVFLSETEAQKGYACLTRRRVRLMISRSQGGCENSMTLATELWQNFI